MHTEERTATPRVDSNVRQHVAALQSLEAWDGGIMGPKFTWADIQYVERSYPTLYLNGFVTEEHHRLVEMDHFSTQRLSEVKSPAVLRTINRAADILRTMTNTPALLSELRNDDAAPASYLAAYAGRFLGAQVLPTPAGGVVAAAVLCGMSVDGVDDRTVLSVPVTEVAFYENRAIGNGYGETGRETVPPGWSKLNEAIMGFGFPDLTDYLEAMAYSGTVTGYLADDCMPAPWDQDAHVLGEPLFDVARLAEEHAGCERCSQWSGLLEGGPLSQPRSARFIRSLDYHSGLFGWLRHVGADVPTDEEIEAMWATERETDEDDEPEWAYGPIGVRAP